MDIELYTQEGTNFALTKEEAYAAKEAIQKGLDSGRFVRIIVIVDVQSGGRMAFYFDKEARSFFWFIDVELPEAQTGDMWQDVLQDIGHSILDEGPWSIGTHLDAFEVETLRTLVSCLDASKSSHPDEVNALREKVQQYLSK
jgi:hypothetical protein